MISMGVLIIDQDFDNVLHSVQHSFTSLVYKTASLFVTSNLPGKENTRSIAALSCYARGRGAYYPPLLPTNRVTVQHHLTLFVCHEKSSPANVYTNKLTFVGILANQILLAGNNTHFI
ncbi:hypothetical protein AQUCO_01800100v1 [Aquilegia coerulea]|uniref:Uncharacterized protein n=1 Tax=Aquilegia coerulea TaxID=218851 RepID=A0A2G5DJX7_AQUCA|nr:hypothetical protein AQUCO_01800100v1 [Aquilegia coerulea]